MPYKPGESGNLLGRPRVGLSLANALRRRFPPERIADVAESLLMSEDDRVRMVALQFIADRGYGKVVNAPPADDADEDAIDVSHIPLEERRAMLATVTRMGILAAPVPNDDTEH